METGFRSELNHRISCDLVLLIWVKAYESLAVIYIGAIGRLIVNQNQIAAIIDIEVSVAAADFRILKSKRLVTFFANYYLSSHSCLYV